MIKKLITAFLSRPLYVPYNYLTHIRREQFMQLQVFSGNCLCRWHNMQIWQSA